MLSEAEKRRVLIEWNDTRTEYPRNKTIHQLFEEEAVRTPEAPAVRFGGQTVTFRELNERANQIAYYLHDFGVRREALVGLCIERSVEMVVGLLGILKTGAAYLPLDPEYPENRLAVMLSDTATPLTLAHRATAEKLTPHTRHTRVVCLDDDWPVIASQRKDNFCIEASAEDLAYVMYTSGSTGRPKGVMVTHRAVVRLVKNTNYCDFSQDQVFLQLAPISFDASTFEIWGALLNGAQLAVMPAGAVSLPELGRAIQSFGVTTLWLTAGLFHLMVEQRVQDLRPLHQLVAGGDVLSPAHVRDALKHIPHGRLINGYGPTEGTTFSCCYSMTAANPPGDTVPIGAPISNTTIYVLGPKLQPVAIGEPGDLYIGGDGLARGYWNDGDLTSQKFVPNPFCEDSHSRLYRTGDVVRYRADGNVEFVGRTDNQVKVSGHRIEPGEIEVALSRHPAVRQAVVVARTDGGTDKRLAAYVVPATAQTDLAAELRTFLAATLPRYMVPSAIVVMKELPLSPNGKIDRAALPGPDTVGGEPKSAPAATPADTEMWISQVWKKVLRVESLGRDDNFFDLGGDSLLLIEAHAELEKLFPRELSINDMFEHTTVRSLARHITEASGPEPGFAQAEERAARQREALARQKQAKTGRC
jgi:amino acid adenylation domain-containing protein